MDITFSDPIYLWFLLGIPIIIAIHIQSLNKARFNAIKFANFDAIHRIVGRKQVLSKNISLLAIRCSSLVLIVLAMTGVSVWYTGFGSAADFVLAIDTSSSMTIKDFSPDRISSAKTAAKQFVDEAPPNSKIGVVSFSGSPFVEQNLNDNRITSKKTIDDIFVSATGGTNIGDAIVTSVNSLLESNNTRVIVLLTDGQTNIGTTIDDATKYANQYGVVVHTIGIGTEEGGVLEGTDLVLSLNEQDLVRIAMETKGQYFRATSSDVLTYSYGEIAKLTEQKIRKGFSMIFTLLAFVLLLVEWFLINTKYRTIP
jgi:Ca-activated chloride channel family protein